MLRFIYIGKDRTKLSQLQEALDSSHFAGSLLDNASTLEATQISRFRLYKVVFIEDALINSDFIRNLRESEWCLPVIVLMDNSTSGQAEQALKSGAIDYLSTTDVERGNLSRSIRYALGLQESWVALRDQHLSKAIQGNVRDLSAQKRDISEQERFFSLSLDMLCIIDTKGDFKRVNPALQKTLGFGLNELIGKSALDFLHPEDRAASELAMGQLADGLPVMNFVNRFRCRDNSYRSILWVTAPYSDHFYAAGRDITERVENERTVQESQRFLQSTLDALASHIAVLDENGRVIAVNKAWRQFFEKNEGNAASCGIGAKYIEVCESAHGDCADEAMTVSAGIRSVMASRQETFSLEYPCHSPTEQRWFNVNVTRFVGEGPVRVVVAHKNVTERKQAESQRDRFFELSLNVMMVSDLEGIIRQVNPAWTRILGYSLKEIQGRKFIDFVHPDDSDVTQKEASRIYGGETTYGFENRYRCRDGSYKLLEWNSIFHSETRLIYSVCTDITERKRTEETMRANEERLRFVTDNARVGLVVIDGEHRYTFANTTYSQMLGLPTSDLVGQAVADVLAPLYEEQIRPKLDRAFAGERVAYELRQAKADENRYFMVKYEPKVLDGTVQLVVVVITDITERKQSEEAIRESESRVAGIVNAAMDAIITVDAAFQIVLFNPAAERVFGYESADVIGQSIERLMPMRFRAGHAELIGGFGQSSTISRRMNDSGDISGMRANGEEFPIEASISQIEIAGQTLFTVILRDITERRLVEAALHRAKGELELRVEERTTQIQNVNESLRIEGIERKMAMDALRQSSEALRDAQQMLQLVMNHIPQAIFWKDRNSAYLGCNYRLARDAGYVSPEEVIGKNDLDMPWAEYAADYQADDRQVIETDTAKLNIVEPLLKADGSPIWLRTNKIPLHDNENNVVGVLCSYEDITEQKLAESAIHAARQEAESANKELRVEIIERQRAETEVQQSQQELQNFIDAMSTLAAKVDANGTFLIVNKVAVDASGLSHETYMKTNFLKGPWWTYDPEVETRVRDMFRQALSGITINYDENIFVFGQIKTINFSLIPMRGTGGAVEYLIAEGRDITELKHTEEALRLAKVEAEAANMAKSEFLSRMSHELRTPMNSILGFAQILEMSSTDAKLLQRVKHIMKAGRHLLRLINEVLDVARVESGQLSLSPEPVQIGNIIQMAADIVQPLCQQNSVQIEIDLSRCSDLYVQADQQRLSQVLLNLLANATKYNRENGKIRVQGETRSNGKLRINILDTGYGIDKTHLAKLFRPFERLGREGGLIEGTGLGLSLSQRIMAAMGGTIGVESTVGTGSTFWIELPLVEGPLGRIDVSSIPVSRRVGSAKPRTILYIEDNTANLQVLEHLLEEETNLTLISAMQGLIGIELALQHQPSLILLDLHLPDMAGDEVLRRILSEPTLRKIPVIMVSADATPSQISRLLAAGAVEYLTKPLDLQEFLSVMHKYLSALP